MAILELKKPTHINGEEVTEISYDLEGLTGRDSAQAIRELAKREIIVSMTEVDQNYHAAMFAIAAGISIEDVQQLSAKDYQRACIAVRDFFLED